MVFNHNKIVTSVITNGKPTTFNIQKRLLNSSTLAINVYNGKHLNDLVAFTPSEYFKILTQYLHTNTLFLIAEQNMGSLTEVNDKHTCPIFISYQINGFVVCFVNEKHHQKNGEKSNGR